jgi:Phage integrase, N-terminal SAM-like domain
VPGKTLDNWHLIFRSRTTSSRRIAAQLVAPDKRGGGSARFWIAVSVVGPVSLRGWVTKKAVMADTETPTTVLTAEVVRYDDQVILTECVAVSAFIAGYTDPTRRSYATDLRIFAGWCHDHGFNLLNVKRPHLETFARCMEQEGRMASTIGRRLSTLSSFDKYCQTEDILDKNPGTQRPAPKDPRRVTHPRPRSQ